MLGTTRRSHDCGDGDDDAHHGYARQADVKVALVAYLFPRRESCFYQSKALDQQVQDTSPQAALLGRCGDASSAVFLDRHRSYRPSSWARLHALVRDRRGPMAKDEIRRWVRGLPQAEQSCCACASVERKSRWEKTSPHSRQRYS